MFPANLFLVALVEAAAAAHLDVPRVFHFVSRSHYYAYKTHNVGLIPQRGPFGLHLPGCLLFSFIIRCVGK